MNKKDTHRFNHSCHCVRCLAQLQPHPCPLCSGLHGYMDGCIPCPLERQQEIEQWRKTNLVPMDAKQCHLPPIIPCYHTRLSMAALWRLECCKAIVVYGMYSGNDMYSLHNICYNEECIHFGKMVYFRFLEYGCSECYLGNLTAFEFNIHIHNITEVTTIWNKRHNIA